jgi:hypothetical protein
VYFGISIYNAVPGQLLTTSSTAGAHDLVTPPLACAGRQAQAGRVADVEQLRAGGRARRAAAAGAAGRRAGDLCFEHWKFGSLQCSQVPL